MFTKQCLSRLQSEIGSIVDVEDLRDNPTNNNVTWLVKFMRNRQRVIICSAINGKHLAYIMRQQYDKQ